MLKKDYYIMADPEMACISLLPSQITHVEKIIEILEQSPCALDLSMLGTGKTYTSCKVAQFNKYKHVIVICPLSVKGKWRMMETTYNIPIIDILTFSCVRGQKGKLANHGLLHRRDFDVDVQIRKTGGATKVIHKVEFTVTDIYKEYVREGLLLIIDEIQNLKNIGSQMFACRELIKCISGSFNTDEPSSGSRVLLLSGSPIDKVEQAVHFFRLVDIMKQDSLAQYNPYTYVNKWTGFNDIVAYMTVLDAEETRNIVRIRENSSNVPTFISLSYSLFQNIFKKHRSAAMPPFVSLVSAVRKFNSFYECSEDNMNVMKEGLSQLISASGYNATTNTVAYASNGGSFGQITRALIMIETAKIDTFVRIALTKLGQNPFQKVIICVNYLSSIVKLQEYLHEWTPLILTGSLPDLKRRVLFDKFQAPTLDHRILIANMAVCGAGIDLDDQNGLYPRHLIINPNYNTITLYQVSHRIYRQNTQSDSSVEFVYLKRASEIKIMQALATKSQVMKETTNGQATNNMKFQCDIDGFYEGHQDTVDPNIQKFYKENTKGHLRSFV